MKETIELMIQNTYGKKNKKSKRPEALITAKRTFNEEPLERMEKTTSENRFSDNRLCRFYSSYIEVPCTNTLRSYQTRNETDEEDETDEPKL